MAQKKVAKKKSELAYPISYTNIYCLTLFNGGAAASKEEGSTYAVLRMLVSEEIGRIDRGEGDESRLKPLLVIAAKLDAEFEKGRDDDD